MDTEEKYTQSKQPAWVETLSDGALISLSKDSPENKELKRAGKGLVYIKKEIIHTTYSKNEKYILETWSVSNPEILQSSSINEFLLNSNDRIIFHRIGVIRDESVYIDKLPTLTIRVLDDEVSSDRGTINKRKKVHCVMEDVRFQDTLVLEYTVETVFTESNFLDKKYFRYSTVLPVGYWFYKKYEFSVINNRKEDISVAQKYFRNEKNEKIDEPISTLKEGETFTFSKEDFHPEKRNEYFLPYLEFATVATWTEIASYIYAAYTDILEEKNIEKNKAYVSLAIDPPATEESIRKIIEYVQNEIFYLYDAQVMHTHIPEYPSKTLEQRSGDCKAKSALLVNMLRTIGVEADTILVNYDYDYLMSESLPSPFVFNHCIVKIKHNDKDYFVDPVWTGNCGLLSHRTEPFFSNYLPISKHNEGLMHKALRKVDEAAIEEHAAIALSDDDARIELQTTYRKEAADGMRNTFRKSNINQLTKEKNEAILERMEKNQKNKEGDSVVMENVEYKIVADNTDLNELRVVYNATAMDIFRDSTKKRVFKYYYKSINSSAIAQHEHKDHKPNSFLSLPLKYSTVITSNRIIDRTNAVTKRETFIDNKYFHFSNKKTLTFKTVTVESQYVPCTYDHIAFEDLKDIQADYRKIHDSNFGVGVVDVNWLQFVGKHLYIIVLAVYLISMIVGVVWGK